MKTNEAKRLLGDWSYEYGQKAKNRGFTHLEAEIAEKYAYRQYGDKKPGKISDIAKDLRIDAQAVISTLFKIQRKLCERRLAKEAKKNG